MLGFFIPVPSIKNDELHKISLDIKDVKQMWIELQKDLKAINHGGNLAISSLNKKIDTIIAVNDAVMGELMNGMNDEMQKLNVEIVRTRAISIQNTEKLMSISSTILKRRKKNQTQI